jgi:hypothetical protein
MIQYNYSSAPTFADLSQEEQTCIAESLVPGESYDVIINPPIYSENPHHSGGGTSFIIQRGSTITVEIAESEPEVESLPTYDDASIDPPPNFDINEEEDDDDDDDEDDDDEDEDEDDDDDENDENISTNITTITHNNNPPNYDGNPPDYTTSNNPPNYDSNPPDYTNATNLPINYDLNPPPNYESSSPNT